MDLATALGQLDPTDDAQWTGDGLPLVKFVADLIGDPDLTRKQITEVRPDLTRTTAGAQPELEPEPVESRREIERVDREIAAIEGRIRELNEEIRELSRTRAQLSVSLGTGYNAQEDQARRMEFIRKQAELRQARAGKSNLDRAMSGRKPRPEFVRRPPRLMGQ